MKLNNLSGTLGVTVPILGLAIWIWILDVIGIDAWAAHTIGRFIGMVIEVAK